MSRDRGPETLPVALNRDRLNGVSVPDRFECVGQFRVGLENADSPVHVHLRFDGPLGQIVDTTASNHYLEPGDRMFVDVTVAELDDPVAGTLTVVTGHGSVEETVQITVAPLTGGPVEIDPAVTRPESDPTEADPPTPSLSDRVAAAVPTVDTGTALVVGFAVGALALAVTAQVTVASTSVTLGLAAVLAAVVAAGYTLRAG
ncbi:MAG: hypothetical protein J07HB67_00928 [halophilic archaeon J07HB67]|nr:MAG: hypothetical protein J07HB67_00928 [halophilic archaeon J07HB67]